MSASADCSCRARKGLRALPPASVVMCKVGEAAGGGVGGRRADGGRKQGGQSAAFYRRVPRPGVRAVGPSGHRAGGASGRRGGAAGGAPGAGAGGVHRRAGADRNGMAMDNRAMSITIKSAQDIAGMRLACRLASEVLDSIAAHIQTGITTRDIDRIGAECMARQGTVSATVGYQPPGYPPYPASLCTSVNHVVCHGIPNDKPLKKGDIV